MTRSLIRHIASVTFAIVIACLIAAAVTVNAQAAGSPKVSGYDYYGTAEPVAVLAVEGSAGDTIYVDVERGGKRAAARLSYTLTGDKTTGVFDISLNGQEALDNVTIRAYANRVTNEPLFEGSIYPVYAALDGGAPQLVALRTLAPGDERPFVPAETLFLDTKNYCLERDAAGLPVVTAEGNALTYAYKSYSPQETEGGSIRYVDENGTTVSTREIAAIAQGESKAINIPVVVKGDDGSMYRTISFTPTVVASNPGQRDFVVACRKLSISAASDNKYYVATINLVDENGALLASDSVNVTGTYVYTAPLTMYLDSNGKSATYDIADKSKQTLVFDAERDNVTSGSKTFTIAYQKQPEDPAVVSVRYNLIDATKTRSDSGRIIGTDVVDVDAADPIAVPPQDALMVNNEPYVLAGDMSMYQYDFEQGGIPEINVYYVPENYVAPGPYDVTVQYVNLANNTVITTKTVEASPDQLSDLQIESDPTFSLDGVDYVRLAGQEDPIAHNYYSNARVYTVYYRDVNDDLTADIVITRIRVIYDDVITVALDETGEPIADDATPLALNPDGTYTAINGDGTGLITNEAGVDSNTERIEDAENPLAAGLENGGLGAWLPLIIGACIALVIAIIVAIIVAGKRREANEVESE